MTALEQSINAIAEAKAKVELIGKLKKVITLPIMQLCMAGKINWVTLGDMTMNDGIKFIKQIKGKKWTLEGRKSTYNNSEDFKLLTFIKVDGIDIRVAIPINDIKEPHMSFRRTGSTSRSKAVGINVLKIPPQFNYYKVCNGLFTVEYY